MTANICPSAKLHLHDSSGNPLSGGKVYFYTTGGSYSTPKDTYTTSAASVANANPVILDSRGEATVYLSGDYDMKVTDSNDVLIYTQPNINSGATSAAITFTSDATGAVQRTVKAKLEDQLSVLDFGATGDGSTDDTSAIQAAINAASSSISNIYFPSGTYVVSSKLTITSKLGLMLTGAGGASGAYNSDTAANMCQTHILWKGAAAGDMLEMDACRGMVFRGLNFVGQDGAGNKANTLVKLISTTGATGSIVFEFCGFEDAVNGVECGDIAADTNNSDILFIRPFFRNLTSGLLVNNENGLNYEVHSPVANTVDYIFDFAEGGCLTAFNVTNHADYVLRIREGGGGKNVGNYNFFGVRMEYVGAVPAKFLYTDSATVTAINAIVNVHGMLFNDNQPGTDYTFEIHGGVDVNIMGSRINDQRLANISGLSNSYSSLDLIDCRLDVDTWTESNYITKVNAYCNVTYDHLRRNDGKFIQHVTQGDQLISTDTHRLHETAAVELTAVTTWYDVANINLPSNHEGARVRVRLDENVQGVGYGARDEEWTIYRTTGACVAENIGSATDVPSATPRYSFQWVAGVDNNHMDLQVQRLGGGATATSVQVLIEATNMSDMNDIVIADGAS